MLRRYVDHELSHTVFIDQCFTLEHNNGSLFDKYFATDGLLTVLDAQAAGDLVTLAGRASPEVRRLWQLHEERRFLSHDPAWLGRPTGARPERADAPPPPPRTEWTVREAWPGSLGCGSSEEWETAGRRDEEPEGTRLSSVGHGPRRTVPVRDGQRLRGATAELHTALGVIRAELWPEPAPHTVDNFVRLARGSRPWKDPFTGDDRTGRFYDGTVFHRRIPGFLIQGGDRTGTGTGGPGFRIPDEMARDMAFDRPFLLGMANTGPNSAGSQFFITLSSAEHLSGAYCRFGEVLAPESRAVVRAIAEAEEAVELRRVEVTTW
ncbi:peptidylprolyl isomerase [Streptomyces radicis]|uniref:peptidylprolyl isomerase n=2 Tax=Streptomyces radicis TaxID=1750517 RepID=A0A3A9VT62_9ACTN|nr:peptidylprolyl isomerase [Streptomyces radicis]RKN14789.1 peptidylprolyl isomerase [Streptomyces radicis]